MWTIEQYLHWHATVRDEDRKLDDCAEADRLIKETALTNFNTLVDTFVMPTVVSDWLKAITRTHYGSIDVDQVLSFLTCYPEWMVTDLKEPQPTTDTGKLGGNWKVGG